MAKKEKNAQAEQRYELPQLRANCNELFGVSCYAFDGAMKGQKGPFTIGEADALIRDFERRPVVVGKEG